MIKFYQNIICYSNYFIIFYIVFYYIGYFYYIVFYFVFLNYYVLYMIAIKKLYKKIFCFKKVKNKTAEIIIQNPVVIDKQSLTSRKNIRRNAIYEL